MVPWLTHVRAHAQISQFGVGEIGWHAVHLDGDLVGGVTGVLPAGGRFPVRCSLFPVPAPARSAGG
jgi:hypothetical protein